MGSLQRDGEVGDRAGHVVGGRFRIEQALGSGAMGAVYRVRDERADRVLALKQLRAVAADKLQAATVLFEREYYTLSELAHPCIIQVFDYGVDRAGPYYTMELLPGPSLRELAGIPWRRACALLRDVAHSLAILHSRRLLHRDLSPRNVMCTAEQRAKLIDFGAMTPMGTPNSLVGTPPLVPPEALQLQALDARADLYSLGALGYFLLMGRHAYPARTFDQLRDRFRSIPKAPHRANAAIPQPLSALIMQLLNLDRAARPATACELIERLSSLAELPAEDVTELSRAYLTTPSLVGREAALVDVRKAMTTALRNESGGAMVLEGESGSGRSRMLDACVLEAKLMGALVLRAHAGDGARGDYGAMSALCEQLLSLVPNLANETARLRATTLSRIVPALASPDEVARGDATAERRLLQTALRDWFRAVSRRQRLVIAVDDFNRIDEPSAAVLAALSHQRARRRLFVVVTADDKSTKAPALALLRKVASHLRLEHLDREQTERLVASLFGNSASTTAMAERVYGLSEGNPRLIMELAEHLVARGLSRFSGGMWLVSDAASGGGGLPESVSVTLRARMHGLPDEARELANVLSLADSTALSIEHYPKLVISDDRLAVFRALDALVTRGVIVGEGSGYRFAHREWGPLLARRLPQSYARALHERLADLAYDAGPPNRLAYHLMEAGRIEEAVEVLYAHRFETSFGWSLATLELVERALEPQAGFSIPAGRRIELQLWLLAMSSVLGQAETFTRHAPDMLARLERDSGLMDFDALQDESDDTARLHAALLRALERHQSTPEPERGLPPPQAIEWLVRLCAMFGAVAAVMQDLRAIEALPSLTPLRPLSPAVHAVDCLLAATRDLVAGRTYEGREAFLRLNEDLGSERNTQMHELMRREIRFGVTYALGQIEAAIGIQTGPSRVAELQLHERYRVNAWRVHAIYHMMRSDPQQAQACQRRAELFRLQDGNHQAFPGSPLRIEARAYWLSEDLVRTKETLARIRRMRARFPAWEVIEAVTQSNYRRLRGDPAGALAAVEPLLVRIRPTRHLDWPFLAAAHVGALAAMGRTEEAAEVGARYVDTCTRERLQPNDSDLLVATAQVLCSVGQAGRARQMIEQAIARCEQLDVRGINLGHYYEGLARVAMHSGDRDDFVYWARRCGSEYGIQHNQAFAAKHARLMQEAARTFPDLEASRAVELPPAQPNEGAAETTVLSRLSECLDRQERAQCALTILLEETGARRGYLFGFIEGRLRPLAVTPGLDDIERVSKLLEDHISRELAPIDTASESTTTQTSEVTGLEIGTTVVSALVLRSAYAGETVIGAAAALVMDESQLQPPPSSVVDKLIESLVEHDDVDPVTQPVY